MAIRLKFRCKSVTKEDIGTTCIKLVNNEYVQGVASGDLIFNVHESHKALKVFKSGALYYINITKIK